MREIKFRAWDKNGQTMHDVGLLLIGHGATAYSYPQPGEEANVGTEDTNSMLMQFTGLKDKNGKEIYEGDIVRFIYNSTPQEERIGPVEWNEEYCSWWFGKLLIEPTPRKTMEVIGNIYENPELLKEK